MRQSHSLAAGVASLALVCAAPAFAAGVGTAGAANTRSTGAIPGGSARVIEIGEQVVANERIATSNSGSVQVVFIDKTTLNIGPNSEIVIDRFVFNPASATGEMALTLSRGALRIVGGQATHTGGATISTPVATIGVRGGIAQISHCPKGGSCGPAGTQATNVFGRMSVESGGVSERITRPDFTTNVAGRDTPPGAPVRASASLLAQNLSGTTSKPGQSGGARSVPSDTTALAAGTGDANRNLSAPQSVPVQAQTTAAPLALAGAVPQAGGPAVGKTVSQGQQAAATGRTIQTLPAPVVPVAPVPPVTPVLPVQVVVAPAAYLLTSTAGPGSNIPFLTASFATAGGASVTPVTGYRPGGLNADGTPSLNSRAFQASLVIDGTGAAQTSTLNVMTGLLFKSDNAGMIFEGHFRGSRRTATDRFPDFVVGDVFSSTQSGGTVTAVAVPTDATGLPIGAFPVTQNFNSAAGNAVTASSGSAVQGVNPQFYTFDQTFAPATAPAQLGSNHPVATLTGYAGGIARTTSFIGMTANGGSTSSSTGPAFIVTNATGSPGDISVSLQSGSRIAADFALRNLKPAGTANEFATAKLGFGEFPSNGATTYSGTRGAYVDLTHFAAIERRVGPATSRVADSSINGVQGFTGGTLVNANVFTSAIPGFTPCVCDFTQWGLWSMDSIRSQNSAGTAQTEDRTGIAFWVAGTPSTFAAMPTVGSATYFGHAVASVATGPASAPTAQYIAGGPFGASVNFATRAAIVGISNLDGASYGGIVSFAPGAATFGGALASTVPGRNMAINGTLFQAGAASPVGEIGGGLNVQGTNYLASGIFLGKKL